MKFIPAIFLLVFAPLSALAQENNQENIVPAHLNYQTSSHQSVNDSYQIAYADISRQPLANNSPINPPVVFTAYPDLYQEKSVHTEHAEAGALDDWRERIFLSLNMNIGPRRYDEMNIHRLASNDELEKLASDQRSAIKIIIKETLNYAREQFPGIDRLINSLRIEISNMPAEEITELKATGGNCSNNGNGSRPGASTVSLREDKLYFKTGLRLPVDGGRVNLVSENEIKFGKVTSFMNVYLDGRFDRSAGLTYAIAKNMQLQVERWDAHTTDPATGDQSQATSRVNLIHLVYAF